MEDSGSATLHEEERSYDKKKRTPLPWKQLSIVYLIQFAEPITSSVIFPFINQFVRETGITKGDEQKTGYFAGLIESTFFFAEAVAVIPWGIASDRFGRRPVLLLGPLGLAVAMLGFGMSTRLFPMVVFRWVQGMCNGNIGMFSVFDGDILITDSSNIADAFAFLPVVWATGVTIGPFVGGVLSQPAARWPDTFGRLAYFNSHPYFLPCFAASLLAFLVFIAALTALEETLPSALLRRPSQGKTNSSTESLFQNDDRPRYGSTNISYNNSRPEVEDGRRLPQCGDDTKPLSVTYLLKLPEVQVILINHGFLAFCTVSVQVLIPLMWSTSIENGGLGLSPYTIGMTLGSCGVVNAFLQLMFLGKIMRRFGPRQVHIVCFSSLLGSFLSFPIANFFARRANGMDRKAWATVIASLGLQSMRSAAYGSLSVITTGSAPNQSSLGTMNGLAQAMGCISRSLSPSFASSLHSISLQYHLAGGNAVYYIMMVIVAIGIRFTFMLPKRL
ncbi:major facilitator superfamily domain-containing protein [Amanita rubescens]|nr:major facilitator superfamily domain-containing protein [Amanita rubescens]